MALRGIKVIELAGLAPAPFCGMVLSDFGARVIRVDKTRGPDMDKLARGKESIAVDLKQTSGREIVQKLCNTADVLIEPFRPGVMEKLGLGPDHLLSKNPRLVYARMTGYGQSGSLANKAGHDINYLAISGVLSRLGRKGEKPYAPVNLLADFAGGGLTCALGIMMALFERSTSGKGQVVDAAMVEGAAYVATFLNTSRSIPGIWAGNSRGDSLLDGGAAFYETYKTKDGKYMSVGAIEPQFYSALLEGLGLSEDDCSQFSDPAEMKAKFTELFATKTRDEWEAVFSELDGCVAPILELDEAPDHPHNKARGTFLREGEEFQPRPAPLLGRTPGVPSKLRGPQIGQHTEGILAELGYGRADVEELVAEGTVLQAGGDSKL